MSQIPESSHNLPVNSSEKGTFIVFDLRTLTQFKEEAPFVRVLSDIGTAQTLLLTFKAGQQLTEHSTSSQMTVQVLRGRITFMACENQVKLQAGLLVQLEAHVQHSMRALTDAVMLITLTPSPEYHTLRDQIPDQDFTPLVARAPAL